MPIMWREALTIDHGPIDRDHHTLIAIINTFETVEPGPDAAARLADVIGELEKYGSTHFAREERLQRLVAFPFADVLIDAKFMQWWTYAIVLPVVVLLSVLTRRRVR